MEPSTAFSTYLRKAGLKSTPQRMSILNVFLDVQGHVTAEELYERVKRRDPSIGQATVYRTLKLLSDAGLALEVDFSDGAARYEPGVGGSHHDHLVCERCRRTIEIVDEGIERRQEKLAAQHGFELTGHSMCLYGLCPDCRGRAT